MIRKIVFFSGHDFSLEEKMMRFQFEIQQDGMTVESLLRGKWRLGRKLVHELRMAKAVKNQDGAP